ncbi:uncharacterized protein N7515_002570 [Penicillium bovifimosum]|uniref:Mitochondrial thiamine pyrophosphate carrier 1 n=1 Tax=Penicillium bovifimosum TaxID=126998 RepID=A0A9W9HDZ4_9EURO|nr:uncharacterized protein N7515_002570 [Penicillium bovifimosum]KAJ5143783.1 hypothetical protein N7515_002570 [Penicillium bovifimosum]
MSVTGTTAPDANNPSIDDPQHGCTSRPKKSTRSLDFIIRNGLAGGIAGCAAKTIVAPLERVRILFQTSHATFIQYTTHWTGPLKAAKHIKTTHGLPALFKGHTASLLRIFPYAAINFLAYEQLREAIITTTENETPSRRFLCGSIAGAISTLLTYPLELIRTRLAFETQKHSSSWLGITQKICSENTAGGRTGLSNLYRGIAPTMLGILPYAGMSFLTHDQIKDWLLSCGALAGIVAQTVSYPIEIVRRRIQVAGVVGDRLSIVETSQRVFRERGVRGFFIGLNIGYVKMAPMVATSFYVYDRMKRYLGLAV